LLNQIGEDSSDSDSFVFEDDDEMPSCLRKQDDSKPLQLKVNPCQFSELSASNADQAEDLSSFLEQL